MIRDTKLIIHPSKSADARHSICENVSILQNQPLDLNGNLADLVKGTVPILQNSNTSRTIVLRCFFDLSAVTFTVTGTQNGRIITEDIIGPVGGNLIEGEAESEEFYDEIISIVPNNDSNGRVNIGLGNKIYILKGIDLNLTSIDYSLSLTTNSTEPRIEKLELYNSLEQLRNLPFSYKEIVNNTSFLHLIDEKTNPVSGYVLPYDKTLLTKTILCYFEIEENYFEEIIFNFIQV